MILQVQAAVQAVEEGMGAGGVVAIALAIVTLLLFMVERILFFFKSFIKKDDDSSKIDALYRWHKPDRPNHPGVKIWWMPWPEFESLMERSIKTNEELTQVLKELARNGR